MTTCGPSHAEQYRNLARMNVGGVRSFLKETIRQPRRPRRRGLRFRRPFPWFVEHPGRRRTIPWYVVFVHVNVLAPLALEGKSTNTVN